MRLVFMGTSSFAVPSLARLAADGYQVAGVVTQPDRPAGRGRAAVFPPVKVKAAELGLPIWQPETLRTPEAIEHLRALQPEVIVVAAYGQILRPAVLDIPPLGCLNIHASLLPKLRGASPVAFAILEGYEETGVTVMQMDPGMDTGPILSQRSVPIRPQDTTLSLTERLAMVGADLISETLPAWQSGQIIPRVQDKAQATYTRILRKEDGVIDWAKSAHQIWREVRAFHPWPGSSTTWRGKLLKILEVKPLTEASPQSPPGTVIPVQDPDSPLAVVTGQGLLLLLRLQMEGRRPVSGAEFLRGHPAFVGSTLG